MDVASAPVTAVVPTHRRPELMRAAVQSILSQDYAGPIEVVVVFDACEAELPDVELAADRTLRAVVNERTRGLAGARNAGILAASHDFVAFLDDDDVWLPGKLAAQMPLFEAHPQARLVGTASRFDDGRRGHDRLAPSDLITHGDLVEDRITALHSSSFVFRRAALVGEIGLIDEELPRGYGEDTDVLLRASAVADIPLVNRPLVSVRWQGQSYFLGQWAQYAQALTYLLAKHPDIEQSPAAAARLRSQIAFGLVSSDQRREGREVARQVLRVQPTNLRAWLALAIGLRLATPHFVQAAARRLGKGI
ncbi:hypothetical protein ASD11_12870 [Aeromicrobium sp. Root495]|nr:hypothetical protein ASD11_12870 [Aeromicrobium sp. Root495]